MINKCILSYILPVLLNISFIFSITQDLPLETENITITDYLSTRLGFCHTIKLNDTTLGKVQRTGQTLGKLLNRIINFKVTMFIRVFFYNKSLPLKNVNEKDNFQMK